MFWFNCPSMQTTVNYKEQEGTKTLTLSERNVSGCTANAAALSTLLHFECVCLVAHGTGWRHLGLRVEQATIGLWRCKLASRQAHRNLVIEMVVRCRPQGFSSVEVLLATLVTLRVVLVVRIPKRIILAHWFLCSWLRRFILVLWLICF